MGISPYKQVPCLTSGHAAGHQVHEVEDSHLGLQSPCQAGPGLEVAKPALQVVGGSEHCGVPLAAYLVVPAFHLRWGLGRLRIREFLRCQGYLS